MLLIVAVDWMCIAHVKERRLFVCNIYSYSSSIAIWSVLLSRCLFVWEHLVCACRRVFAWWMDKIELMDSLEFFVYTHLNRTKPKKIREEGKAEGKSTNCVGFMYATLSFYPFYSFALSFIDFRQVFRCGGGGRGVELYDLLTAQVGAHRCRVSG